MMQKEFQFRHASPILAVIVFVFWAATSAKASFGDYDVTFGSNGTSTDINAVYVPAGMTLQPDGKILVVGSHYDSGEGGTLLILRRYNANGGVDTTFGSDGTAIPYNEFGTGSKVLVQLDGKIVVIGSAVWRFNSNGWYDPTFGFNGKASIAGFAGAIYQIGRSIPPKIIVASHGNGHHLIYRLNSNGTIDTSFGSGGSVTVSLSDLYATDRSFLVRSGSIFVSGAAHISDTFPTTGGAIAKYTINGQPDLSFGNQGIAAYGQAETQMTLGCSGSSALDSSYPSVMIQSTGRIIVRERSINTTSTAVFVGMTASGMLDPSYSSSICSGPYNANWNAFGIIQADDRALDLWGDSNTGPFSIKRYSIDGLDDGQFHFIQTSLADMVEQPDSKILLVGLRTVSRGTFVVLSRHLPN
jgi:uncharacterized delta-60 repeat protein